jgi:prophage regulatory protein
MEKKVLRLPRVTEATGLPRSTIYLKISKKLFPAPILLGARSVGWLESDIHNWIEQQIKQSRLQRKSKKESSDDQ